MRGMTTLYQNRFLQSKEKKRVEEAVYGEDNDI